MTISTDAEKAFDKIQHPFMIKTFQKVGTERTYLNLIKTIYDKITANVILNDEKLKAFPLKTGTRQGIHSYQIWCSFESPSPSNQRRKEIQGIQVGKKVKLSLFADDMILHIKKT